MPTCKELILSALLDIPARQARVGELAADAQAGGFSYRVAATVVSWLVRQGILRRVGHGVVAWSGPICMSPPPAPSPEPAAEAPAGPLAVPFPSATRYAFEQDRRDNWEAVCAGFRRDVSLLAGRT